MKETILGRRALLLACVLVGTLILCGAASGAGDDFIPFNQVYTDNLFKGMTFGGWSNQVNLSDYHDMSWFRSLERNPRFDVSNYLVTAPIDEYSSNLMSDALKNYLNRKTKFTTLGYGPLTPY